jgi:DNA-binding NarL/FixJ family response regulator
MQIKVTITDDHPLVVSGLKNILRPSHHIEVISTYSSGDALLEGLKNRQPDVLLLDLQMPGTAGPELAAIIRKTYPDVSILILTGQEAIFYVQDMMRYGCRGYLLKNTTDQQMLVYAIEEVFQGRLFLEPSLKEELLYGMLAENIEPENQVPTITRRENEVLHMIAAGQSNKEIADTLFLSIRTVESHRLSLLQKLEVKNTAALLHKARQMKLVD